MITYLLFAIVILLIILIYLVIKGRSVEHRDIQNAISSSWISLGLGEKIGALENHAKEIKESYRSFEQLLRVPTERASFGEITLETIFSDQLPPDIYGIRQRILDGKIPDAYIKSSVGMICVDSKFPLDNYSKMLNAHNEDEKASYKKEFFKDVAGHLTKIAEDYVCPDKGSAPFAFAYIPSESVYYFISTEAYEMCRKYAKLGVQVVSPLTLSHKIDLIRAGVHAKKLSESAEKVKLEIEKLSRGFREVDRLWQVFFKTHLRNFGNKAEELDTAYQRLRDEFDNIERLREQ